MSEKASRQVGEHVERAERSLAVFHEDGINAEGVLVRPRFQAASLKIAREELDKAIAIIERTRWSAGHD